MRIEYVIGGLHGRVGTSDFGAFDLDGEDVVADAFAEAMVRITEDPALAARVEEAKVIIFRVPVAEAPW